MAESSPEEFDSSATESNDAQVVTGAKQKHEILRSPEGYFLLALLTFLGILSLWAGVEHALGEGFQPHDTHKVEIVRTAGAFTLVALFLGPAGTGFFINWADHRNRRRKALAELRSSMLPQRAIQAGVALREATLLVEELKTELEARMAVLEEVRRQVDRTAVQAREMEKLTQVDDDTADILNRYFDEVLARRLGDLEHVSRRREWLLGTIGALFIGIISILFAHYTFGF